MSIYSNELANDIEALEQVSKKYRSKSKSEGGSAVGETEAVIVLKDGSSMTRLVAACDSLRRALARVCVCFSAAGQQEVQEQVSRK